MAQAPPSKDDRGDVPARFRVETSATVRGVIDDLADQERVSATDIVRAVLRRHPEYGHDRGGKVVLPATSGPARPFRDWIAPIEAALSPAIRQDYGVFDGTALIVTLAVIDPTVGHSLATQHFLDALERDIESDRRSVDGILAPPVVETWRELRRLEPGGDAQEAAESPEGTSADGDDTPASTGETASGPVESSRVGTHADHPATFDELSRRPFAEALARRIRDVRRDHVESERHLRGARSAGPGEDEVPGKAFLVHMYAPWGAGKTSVLNFLRDALIGKSASLPLDDDGQWLVVDFNAWRNQRIRPPWYALVQAIHGQTLRQLRGLDRWAHVRLWIQGLHWRYSFDGAAWVLAVVVILLGLFALSRQDAAADWGMFTFLQQAVDRGGELWKWSAAAFALLGGLASLIKGLLLGWPKTAQIYLESRKDPLKRLVSVFRRYLIALGRPVAVFIDDLDRCDEDYVVDLLQGIQTLFHESHIVYVVAADRAWICECFEHRYESFRGAIGHPGKPIGHLFMEKIFQISVGLPTVAQEDLQRYWAGLVEAQDGDPATRPGKIEASAEEHLARARHELEGRDEYDAIQEVLAATPSDDGASIAALRAVATEKLGSRESKQKTESFLLRFTHLVEANPRAMKRLVNAFGMAQAVAILSGRRVEEERLALWTILEMRWPRLAEWIRCDPTRIDRFVGDDPLVVPSNLVPLRTDPEVGGVIAGDGVGDALLDAGTVTRIVGRVVVPDDLATGDAVPPAAAAPG